MRKVLIEFVPGLVGACVGAVLGYYVADWMSRHSLYPAVIPGAFAGLACGFCSFDHSKIRGGLCALIALGAGVFTYWKLVLPPFETDGTFLDLIAHIHKLPPIPLIFLGLGTFLGYWWGRETTNPWRHRFSKFVNSE